MSNKSSEESMSLQVLCKAPRIEIVDNFLSAEEMLHILDFASNAKQLEADGIQTHMGNTGFSFEYPVTNNPVLLAIGNRIQNITGVVNRLPHSMRFRHYMTGQSHPVHYDAYNIQGFTLIITALIYLNDVDEGGATFFPEAEPEPISVEPKIGRLALWYGYNDKLEQDMRAKHEGLLVSKGNKFTLTSFIYHDLGAS